MAVVWLDSEATPVKVGSITVAKHRIRDEHAVICLVAKWLDILDLFLGEMLKSSNHTRL